MADDNMNFCPHCGAKLNGPGVFCGKCGKSLNEKSSDNGLVNSQASANSSNNDSNKSLIEKAMDSMGPLEKEEYRKKVKKSGTLAYLELIIGVGCILFAVFTFIDEKNKYYGFSHSLTSNEMIAIIVGIIGGISALGGIVTLVLYLSVKDKL